MSIQTNELRLEIAAGKLAEAADRCNGLAMFDMLPTILGLTLAERTRLASEGVAVLTKRGWTGSAQRLQWACDAVRGVLPAWTPADLPADQVTDATEFLNKGAGRLARLGVLVSSGRLVLGPRDAQVVNTLAAGGSRREQPSEGLVKLLFALADARRTWSISVFRPGQGPHGAADRGLFVSRAVDVSQFGATPVTLSPPASAIAVVTDILARLPAGRYKIGFPRPLGGPRFDPANDVFFPVPDQETADRAFAGTIAVPLSSMLSPAREAVQSAIPPRVSFDALFPDGLDHLHIEARSDTSPLPGP